MEHQKSYFLFTRLSGVTTATSLSGSTQDFLKLLFHMFSYNELQKFSKVKSDLILQLAPQNSSKYQISVKSVKGFGRYEHLKFRPTHWLKYRLLT